MLRKEILHNLKKYRGFYIVMLLSLMVLILFVQSSFDNYLAEKHYYDSYNAIYENKYVFGLLSDSRGPFTVMPRQMDMYEKYFTKLEDMNYYIAVFENIPIIKGKVPSGIKKIHIREIPEMKEKSFCDAFIVNSAFQETIKLKTENGFKFSDISENGSGSIPIVMGEAYKEKFKIGDEFNSRIGSINVNFKVEDFAKSETKPEAFGNLPLDIGELIFIQAFYHEELIPQYFIHGMIITDDVNDEEVFSKHLKEVPMGQLFYIDERTSVIKRFIEYARKRMVEDGIFAIISALFMVSNFAIIMLKKIRDNFERYAVHLALGASYKDIIKFVTVDLAFIIFFSWISAYLFKMAYWVRLLVSNSQKISLDLIYGYLSNFRLIQSFSIVLILLIVMAIIVVAYVRRFINRIELSDFIRGIQHD